jgi:integrase
MSNRNINEKGLVRKRGKYFRRVYINPKKSASIPLNTDSLSVAIIRNVEVCMVEPKIKLGEKFTFSWQNGTGSIEQKHVTLEEICTKYLVVRRQDGIREGTLDIYDRALRNLKSVLGETYPVSMINQDDIYKFREAYSKGWTKSFLNINLRAIKTFLRWCNDEDLLSTVPKIKQVRTPHSRPKYLTNYEYEKIIKFSPPHLRRVLQFYRETGCRLSEPLNGILEGDFLIIDALHYKTNREFNVLLTPELIEIYHEIKSNNFYKDYYSKAFLKACRKAGITGKTFHSLRHTFALRTYLKTKDIYHVKMLLGHSSVKTTEIYTEYNPRKLQQDFPDLVKNISKSRGENIQYSDNMYQYENPS